MCELMMCWPRGKIQAHRCLYPLSVSIYKAPCSNTHTVRQRHEQRGQHSYTKTVDAAVQWCMTGFIMKDNPCVNPGWISTSRLLCVSVLVLFSNYQYIRNLHTLSQCTALMVPSKLTLLYKYILCVHDHLKQQEPLISIMDVMQRIIQVVE